MDVYQKGDTNVFWGVDTSRNMKTQEINLSQIGLTDWVIKNVGLEGENCDNINTLGEYGSLPQDKYGPLCSNVFNYVSVVGTLIYLSGHWSPDIYFDVYQCARYMIHPK